VGKSIEGFVKFLSKLYKNAVLETPRLVGITIKAKPN
jgi:hypothetical protein